MAPFHPLPYEARAFVARALAAFAVFCAIAVVLLAGSAGQVTNAEAKKQDGGGGNSVNGQVQVDVIPAPPADGNGNGNGWGRGGGGGKWDPPEPEVPATPPTPATCPGLVGMKVRPLSAPRWRLSWLFVRVWLAPFPVPVSSSSGTDAGGMDVSTGGGVTTGVSVGGGV